MAGVHLAGENMGFAGEKRPTPVKIPLKVADLLVFDFKVIHAGMPAVPGSKSMRGHIYWAQTARRDGYRPEATTILPWDTNFAWYPGWAFIAETRRGFV